MAVNTDITGRKRMELELRRQSEQLRSLSRHLVHLQEAKRLNLSRELHDRAAQAMTALILQLGALQRKTGLDDPLGARLQTLLGMAQGVMADLHDLAVNLRPHELDRHGLVAALEQYLESFRRRNALDVQLVAPELTESLLPDAVHTTIYLIVQESLTNVVRYAEAKHVRIVLRTEGANVLLTVQVDGRGFDVDEALRRGCLGLLGMRERAEMLDGRLVIKSAPGSGVA